MNKTILFLFLLLFAAVGTSFAQKDDGLPAIILNDKDKQNDYVVRSGYVEILEDKTGKLSIDDVLSDKQQKNFKLFNKKGATPFNENGTSTYWVKFKILNKSSYRVRYIMESYAPHTEEFSVFTPDPHGKYEERESGQQVPFYERDYINKNMVVDLPLLYNQPTIVYARVYSKEYYSSFDFRIKSFNYWSFYSTNEYFFLGLYYGILIIMAVYNLLLFFTLREKVYLYFVAYILCGILNTASDDGLGYQYLWFKAPDLQAILGIYLAPGILILAFILYSRYFLQLKEHFPKQDKLLMRVFYVFLGYFVLSLFIPQLQFLRFIKVIPFAVVFGISIYTFSKEYPPARFFILGSLLVLISVIIIQLRAHGTISGNLFTVYALNYALMVDVLVFSLALSERIKFIKVREEKAQAKVIEQLQENEALKDKVNRELEEKVAERTTELNEANQQLQETNEKLKEMTEKANEMSAKLDLDNWQLQKSNKEAIKARIKDEEVSYTEFLRIFQDDMACYKYLAEIKWNKEFKCRKCGHNKYMDGNKPYSKKCTRCAYPESVTAYTLFHGLRFPIVKAFYLTYLTHKGDSKKTLRELSDILELRRNTCWNFKKKVQEVIDDYQKKNKKYPLNWEEIILD